MPINTPIKLTLYGGDDEPEAEFQRLIAPWGMLKRAIRLSKSINEEDPSEQDMDAIADFIVGFYKNQFTRDDLDDKADMGEVFACFMAIVNKARGNIPNPPPRT